MKTSELIAHVAGVMLDDRVEQLSGVPDSLFADATIVRYLNKAQELFCRRAWVLFDNEENSEAARVDLEVGRSDYSLHPSVLFVKSARLSDTEVDLVRVGYDDNRTRLYSNMIVDPDFWDVNVVMTETPGRPQRFSTDTSTKGIRFRRPPDATAALLKVLLRVVRLPLVKLSVDTPDLEPEIPEEFHLDLCLFAGAMCLSHPSIDAELRSQGRNWMSDFNNAVREAKRDRLRLTYSMPQPRFGGWANGR